MEIGMPFDFDSSAAEPAEYNATIQRMVNAAMITNGIYPQVRIVDDNILDPSAYVGQSLLVSPAEGTLGVVISKGMAQVEGTTYINTADKAITIPADNIDRTYDIVVELDLINGTLTTKSRLREASVTLAQSLTRTDTMYQLALATVTIPANATSVLPAYITDHRLNTDLASDGKPICGLVGSAMQADTRMISDVLYQALDEELVTSLILQVNEAKDTVNETKEQVEDCKASINEIYYVCADGVTTAPDTFYYSTGDLSTWIFPKAIAPPSVTTLPNDFLRKSKVAEFEGVKVTTAGQYLLHTCTALTSVSLPALTTAGNYTLYNCTSLTSASLPALTTAKDRLLTSCTSLTSVSLPELTTAGDYLLDSCTSLTSVSLPALTTAGEHLLDSCTSLTSLTVGGANTLTLTSTLNNSYQAWKLPVSDMVAFGTALKTATSATPIKFAAAYYNALNSTQKAIFTNKNYTITTV